MDEKTLKKLLGEFYIEPTNNNKRDYIDAINKFINLNPSFTPKDEEKVINYRLARYIQNHNVTLLDKRFFAKKIPSSLQSSWSDNKFIEIVLCQNKVKKMILARDIIGTPKELSENLSVTTLKSIYNSFVRDMINPMAIVRDLKEIQTFFDIAVYPLYFMEKENNGRTRILIIHYAVFQPYLFTLQGRLTEMRISSNNNISKISDKCQFIYTDIDLIKKTFFLNAKQVTQKEVFDLISSTMDEKKKQIDKEKFKLLETIS